MSNYDIAILVCLVCLIAGFRIQYNRAIHHIHWTTWQIRRGYDNGLTVLNGVILEQTKRFLDKRR